MKPILIFFTIISFFFSQDELVLVKTSYTSKIQNIEQNILDNVLELYKKRTKKNLVVRSIGSYDFSQLFTILDSVALKNKDMSLMLTAVSITDEREKKYDFSSSYMPAKEVIFGLKKDWLKNKWNFKKKRIGYASKSIQEIQAKNYKERYAVTIKEYESWEHMIIGMKAGEIDAGLMDNVSVWADESLMVIQDIEDELQQGKGLGILYPKGSTLKAKLDPILNYYIKSQKFYAFCTKEYGQEVADYYREHVLLARALN